MCLAVTNTTRKLSLDIGLLASIIKPAIKTTNQVDFCGVEHPRICRIGSQPDLHFIFRTRTFQPKPKAHINPSLDAPAE